MIAIVDLGVGNFANVGKAIGGTVTNDPNKIAGADRIVLPGVGNFGEVARKLEPLREVLLEKISAILPSSVSVSEHSCFFGPARRMRATDSACSRVRW